MLVINKWTGRVMSFGHRYGEKVVLHERRPSKKSIMVPAAYFWQEWEIYLG